MLAFTPLIASVIEDIEMEALTMEVEPITLLLIALTGGALGGAITALLLHLRTIHGLHKAYMKLSDELQEVSLKSINHSHELARGYVAEMKAFYQNAIKEIKQITEEYYAPFNTEAKKRDIPPS
jgi:hypothetical protein